MSLVSPTNSGFFIRYMTSKTSKKLRRNDTKGLDDESVAIFDNLLENKYTTATQHKKTLIKFNLSYSVYHRKILLKNPFLNLIIFVIHRLQKILHIN